MSNVSVLMTPILADVGDAIGYMQSQEFLTWLNGIIGGLLSQLASSLVSMGLGLVFSAPGTIFDLLAGFFLNGAAG